MSVNIAVKPPPYFVGMYYPDLYPQWDFLEQYKIDGDEQKYTRAYYDLVLNRLDPEKVYKGLKGFTLLCWEKPGMFCHRRIVAQWIQDNLGIEVPESIV